jgi:hypothetical protein
MGYPPPPPPPGQPGGYGPPSGPPPGSAPPPGYGGPGYGGPPTGGPGGPGYGGPPGGPGGPGYGGTPPPRGYAPQPPPGGKGSGGSKSLIVLMGALVVVVLLAVVGGLVLLNRDSGGGEVELTEAQLEDALLTAGDVGDGFTVDEASDEEDDDTDDFERDEIDASDECIDLYERYAELEEADEPTVQAEVTFQHEDASQVEQNLEQGSDFGLDQVRELVDTCPEISIDDGETVGTLRFDIVDPVVEPGDESLTLELEVEFTEPFTITVTSLGVLWVRDGTDASINVSGPIDEETFEAGEPDEGLLRDVVERADEKLAEVIDEA